MKLKKKAKKGKGFTLVELLVVVAILAILAAALLPKFLGYTDNAREAQTMADLSTMKSIVEIYAADEGAGNYPTVDKIEEVLTGKGISWTEDNKGVVDPYGRPYVYAVKGEPGSADQHFIIASPGKDGKFGNEAGSASTDDIYVTDNSGQPTKGQIDDDVDADGWEAFVTDTGEGRNASASYVDD